MTAAPRWRPPRRRSGGEILLADEGLSVTLG
jgi:hypothetical protein